MKKIFWKIGLVAAVALCFVFSGAVSAMAATPTWMKLSIGAMNTVGVKSNGSLWAWGNYSGTGGYAQASPMECLVGTTWNDVAAGDNCDFAIKSDGTLWAWGDNTYGQLGIGSTDAQQAAVQVGISTNWASIYAGPCNTFAIQKDGSLWAWGDNTNDQLGIGTSNRALSTPPPAAGTVVVSSPVRVGTDTNWKSVAILDGAVLGLKTDGSLWAWGNNSAGVFGNGNSDMEGMSADSKIPLRIGTANDWATLSAGAAHVVALKTNGTLWTWGMNSEGEVGAGDTTLLHPTATQLGTATWKYAMAGALSTVAVKSDGTLWTWGFNGYGTNNLGTGLTDTYVTSPTQIQGASNWISVVSGNGRSLGLKSDNTLWGWGNWPVGDGTNEDRTVPVLIFDKSMLVDLTSLTNSASGPVLKWTPFPNATGYRIYRNAVEIAEVGPGGLSSYTDTKAVSGMSYGYSICAYTGNIYNQTGSILDNTLTITYLAQPTLTSLTNSATGPLLTWTRSKGATGYYIYRKVPGGAFARIKTIKTDTTLSYADTTAVSGTAYTYTAKAYVGSSPAVTSAHDTTGKTITYVAQPKLTSAVNSSTGVTFTWGKTPGVTGYYVYRRIGTGAWTKVKTITSAATVTYLDKAVSTGSAYTYTVKAYKTSSANVSSFDANGKKVVYVAMPKLTSLANSKSGPVLKWGKITGATGYLIYRKLSGGSWVNIATLKSVSTLTRTDTTAVKGKTYYYSVRAYKTSTANISAMNTTGWKITVKK